MIVENSSITTHASASGIHTDTSICLIYYYYYYCRYYCLQCFDAVGWAAGRASGL